ncbi:hypothetical protein MKW98_012518 [Papaver atlanticum]|uniref:Secreted protein n=1 Tax=Papaver atlanticum TaxID=357466 RepID=A0AAD4XPX7_9MAGN|nr:hypothetical protein MKW98_013668 [Papaver atlanticum]KAI3950888.1 hypothetical protein MKW98_012518 [Papaver atlanticum]
MLLRRVLGFGLIIRMRYSVVGAYASSSHPVHVSFPDSRSSGAVGVIKREVRVVGVVQTAFSNMPKNPTVKPSNSFLGKDFTVRSILTSCWLSKRNKNIRKRMNDERRGG